MFGYFPELLGGLCFDFVPPRGNNIEVANEILTLH